MSGIPLPVSVYKGIIQKWNNVKDYPDFASFDEFYKHCNDVFCSDWNKQDENGKCYEGYYNYPEGSIENINAYTLSRRKNVLELYRLPFPDHVLLDTVEFGCSIRYESVLFSRQLCQFCLSKYNASIPTIQNFPMSECIIDDIKSMVINYASLRTKIPKFNPNWNEHYFLYRNLKSVV
jgi:hypothetical protein